MSPVTKNMSKPGDLYETYSCVRRLHPELARTKSALVRISTPAKPFGSGALHGQGVMWAPTDPDSGTLKIKDGSYLLPKVRPEACDLTSSDYGEGSPAVRRASLLLHSNLCARLAAW